MTISPTISIMQMLDDHLTKVLSTMTDCKTLLVELIEAVRKGKP